MIKGPSSKQTGIDRKSLEDPLGSWEELIILQLPVWPFSQFLPTPVHLRSCFTRNFWWPWVGLSGELQSTNEFLLYFRGHLLLSSFIPGNKLIRKHKSNSLQVAMTSLFMSVFLSTILFIFKEINECTVNPDICGAGHCINLPVRYTCICYEGYKFNEQQRKCVGKRRFW